ncbi:unnamed protein product [marine sediment metagenome]|uniref:Uncharacterized protein n=1 Tax=marine sediment metagenome TaxID=412755 RepID=X1LCD8_9ZZZZ
MYPTLTNRRGDEDEAFTKVYVFPLEGGELADAEAQAVEGDDGVTTGSGRDRAEEPLQLAPAQGSRPVGRGRRLRR